MASTGPVRWTGGFRMETCSMVPVLHSWPVLQAFLPCSAILPMSWQQSSSMPAMWFMPDACIGQGAVGASMPAIPLRGSDRLIRKIRNKRRHRFMQRSVVRGQWAQQLAKENNFGPAIEIVSRPCTRVDGATASKGRVRRAHQRTVLDR